MWFISRPHILHNLQAWFALQINGMQMRETQASCNTYLQRTPPYILSLVYKKSSFTLAPYLRDTYVYQKVLPEKFSFY